MLSRLLLLGVFAVSLSPAPVLAQSDVGVRLGLNAATLTGDFASSRDADGRTGFVGGIYWAVPLRYGLVVQPEILYAQKGFSPTTTAAGEPLEDAALELTYLDVPVVLKYPVAFGAARLEPYAGPFAGIELAERLRIGEAGGGTSDTGDDIASPNLGFVVGIDLRLPAGTFDVVGGARYSRGLTNLLEQRVAAEGRSSEVFTETVSLLVGLEF